jgi:hypothetical protein
LSPQVFSCAASAVRIGATTTSNGEVVPVKCAETSDCLPVATVLNDVAILKLETRCDECHMDHRTFNTDSTYPSLSGTPLTVAGFGLTI